MTSSIYINEKGFEKIWIPFGNNSNSETLCNSMIFMREDKMTSSNYMKYELEVKRNQTESHLELFWNTLSIWSYLGFYSNYFSPKIKYIEIRVKWFPSMEN